MDYNRAFFRNKLGTQFHGTHHKFHFKLLVAEVSLRGIRLRLVTETGCEVYLYLVRLSQLTARCTGAVAHLAHSDVRSGREIILTPQTDIQIMTNHAIYTAGTGLLSGICLVNPACKVKNAGQETF